MLRTFCGSRRRAFANHLSINLRPADADNFEVHFYGTRDFVVRSLRPLEERMKCGEGKIKGVARDRLQAF